MELLSLGTTEKVEKVVFFSVFFVFLKYWIMNMTLTLCKKKLNERCDPISYRLSIAVSLSEL